MGIGALILLVSGLAATATPAASIDYGDHTAVTAARYLDHPYAAAVDGSRAIVGFTRGVIALDLSRPVGARFGGGIPTVTGTAAVARLGCYHFACSDGVRTYSIGSNLTPRERGLVEVLGRPTGLAFAGDLLAVSATGGMTFLDLSLPSRPAFRSQFPYPDGLAGIAAVGDRVYAAAGDDGLMVLRLDADGVPWFEDLLDCGGRVLGVAAGDGVLAVLLRDGVVAADITDPARPRLLGRSTVTGRTIQGKGRTFWVSGDDGAFVLDLGDPAAPRLAATFPPTDGLRGLAPADDGVEIAGTDRGLCLVQHAEWGRVAPLATRTAAARQVATVGTRAFVVGGATLGAFDLTEPDRPVAVGTYRLNDGFLEDVTPWRSYLLAAASRTGLLVLDPRQPSNVHPVGTLTLPGTPMAVAAAGEAAWVTLRQEGLAAVDLAEPTVPKLAALLPLPHRTGAVQIHGSVLYVGDDAYDVQIVDVADPLAPVLKGSFTLPYAPRCFAMLGSTLFVGGGLGATAYDCADPVAPVPVGLIEEGSVQGLAAVGDCLYVATGGSGVRVLDVHDPARPRVKGTFLTGASAWDVAVGATALVVGCGDAGLQVAPRDGSEFPRPTPIAVSTAPDERGGVVPCKAPDAVITLALLGDDGFDAATLDPASVRLGQFAAAPLARDIGTAAASCADVDGDGRSDAVLRFRVGDIGLGCRDGVVFLKCRDDRGREHFGGVLLRADDGVVADDGDADLALAPNPFNPRTRVRWRLAEPGRARVEVFDLRGRRVALLADEVLPAGPHEVTWDGLGDAGGTLPSGTYFVRLRAGGREQVRRAMLLR